jgi:hypothetical protein
MHGIGSEGRNKFRGTRVIPARNAWGCPPKDATNARGRPSGRPSMCLTAPRSGNKIVGLPQGYTAIMGVVPILALNACDCSSRPECTCGTAPHSYTATIGMPSCTAKKKNYFNAHQGSNHPHALKVASYALQCPAGLHCNHRNTLQGSIHVCVNTRPGLPEMCKDAPQACIAISGRSPKAAFDAGARGIPLRPAIKECK